MKRDRFVPGDPVFDCATIDWDAEEEREKRAQRFESGSGGPLAARGDARPGEALSAAESDARTSDPARPAPDSLLPRLSPPVTFVPLEPLRAAGPREHAHASLISRLRLAEAAERMQGRADEAIAQVESLRLAIEQLVADEVISAARARELHGLSPEEQRELWRRHAGNLQVRNDEIRRMREADDPAYAPPGARPSAAQDAYERELAAESEPAPSPDALCVCGHRWDHHRVQEGYAHGRCRAFESRGVGVCDCDAFWEARQPGEEPQS
jgi:hypothetical protein